MSKVKTLQMAIEYINQLQGVLSLQSQSPVHNNHVSTFIILHRLYQITKWFHLYLDIPIFKFICIMIV